MSEQSTATSNALGWRFFLGTAQAACAAGDLEQAEQHYLHALEFAEQNNDGDEHGLAVVLLEFAQFYDDHDQPERASMLWERIRDLLAETMASLEICEAPYPVPAHPDAGRRYASPRALDGARVLARCARCGSQERGRPRPPRRAVERMWISPCSSVNIHCALCRIIEFDFPRSRPAGSASLPGIGLSVVKSRIDPLINHH
ncbi:MAG: tetratricopeptide repeat protein [Terriglobales bacterium]